MYMFIGIYICPVRFLQNAILVRYISIPSARDAYVSNKDSMI